jgi:carboxypeptidase Q
MNKKTTLFSLMLISFLSLRAQEKNDSLMVANIYKEALTNSDCYRTLDYLSNQIGGRLAGSPQAAAAVEYTKQVMQQYGFDTVYLQPLMVPHWVRGEKESAAIINPNSMGREDVKICALGGSIATPEAGLTAPIIEIKSFDELKKLGKKAVQGKIVFYNRPMDPTHLHTFHAYGGAVEQRWKGAMEAAQYGAVGVVVRSMTLALDDEPHTGSMSYVDSLPKIPACAISTLGAERLSKLLKANANTSFYLRMNCETLPDELSYNVVGEIKGKENPKNFIVVGGHLDAWDNGDGAHDDGAGCVQSIEAIRILKNLKYNNRNSLRVVMFMNEENGLRGGKKYAELAKLNREYHVAAIESDAGGFTPRGFTMDADDVFKKRIRKLKPLLEPYGLHEFNADGGGADISPLKKEFTTPLLGLMPDSQRYFDIHHTAADTFDKVNKRELELGAAAMAALVYLMDGMDFK